MLRSARSSPSRGLLLLIRGYQHAISPLLPPACRYAPTCSQYALEAIAGHGALRGAWLGLKRLSRCHPGRAGGYDPVPGLDATGPELPAGGPGDELRTRAKAS